ncbi:hypothetical protein AAJ76_3000033000 [Vairimorpha ceranae]|uniref:Uncharacterized protein n=1 Tax=Vairimorpha ceranae TaxID=40302 RepID=A0A0F9ZBX2_9MICR|nr:hypothetical protein AAJ76_3000033000 [Vairimorpha ceranae]KAF5140191.1 hypothetical protein G9O61_00g016560 [Vairimorpha ceranae]KKO75159.1 hypothetical protein AAJ76_3000033000 [Vairimorpha ceranae]
MNNTQLCFPLLGHQCKGKIVKLCYSNTVINIFEIEGKKSLVNYKGTIKYDKKFKLEEIVNCTIVSYSDNGINCILI